MLKCISWNVNGFRAVLKKGFLDFLAESKPDIIALQEIKLSANQIDFSLDDYYICLLYTSPSPRDRTRSRMPSSA